MWKEILDKELIIINPEISSKKDLFEKMVNHVYNHDYIVNQKKFLEALWDREEMSSTELISEVAFPHARSKIVEKLFLCIIIIKEGIDYHNPELGPAKIIFFFGSSDKYNKIYLQLLAKSSRLLKEPDFRAQILKAQTRDEIYEILIAYDEEETESKEDDNYLMILTLNDVNKMNEVLSSMVEVGITNASIVDTISMAKKLSYEMPIFAGLSYMSQGKSKRSNVIMCYITRKDIAHKLRSLLKKNGVDLDKTGIGFIQLVKVDSIIGNFEEDIDL